MSGDPQLQRRLTRLQRRDERLECPAVMSATERDRWIVELHGRGWDHAHIGRAVGMTRRSVGAALTRIAEGRPGRVRAE